jgi:hypothetical protein
MRKQNSPAWTRMIGRGWRHPSTNRSSPPFFQILETTSPRVVPVGSSSGPRLDDGRHYAGANCGGGVEVATPQTRQSEDQAHPFISNTFCDDQARQNPPRFMSQSITIYLLFASWFNGPEGLLERLHIRSDCILDFVTICSLYLRHIKHHAR